MRILIGVCYLLVSSCTSHGVLVMGATSEAINTDQVALFYGETPNCEFEVVAIMRAPGDFYSSTRLVDAFRAKAAGLGANAVHVHFVQQIGANEFKGQARALKCYRYHKQSAAMIRAG